MAMGDLAREDDYPTDAELDRYNALPMPQVPRMPSPWELGVMRAGSSLRGQATQRPDLAPPMGSLLTLGPVGDEALDTARSAPTGAARGLFNAATMLSAPLDNEELDALAAQGLAEARRQAEERLYQPRTGSGKAMAAVTEVAANPLNSVGPGTLPVKALWNAASGLSGEAAARQFEGTPYEKYARMAGSFGPAVAERLWYLTGPAVRALPEGQLGVGGGKMTIPERKARMGELADQGAYPIEPGDFRVSTRFPTGVGATENPLRQHLSIGLEEMRRSPGFEKNVSVLDTYPGFAHLQGMGTEEAARAYIRQAADNMRYLYERSPQVMKERSPLWYEGAHEISDALARRWGLPRQSVSAEIASLSPQMDWFKNASLAERTGDILTSAAAGKAMTSDMLAMARSPKMAKLFEGEANVELMNKIAGKSLDQLETPLEKALWIRLYDEAHNPRAYRAITPEGHFGDFVLSKTGEPKAVGWGALGEIQKAVRSLESGGNMDLISPILGNKHKVRNFYNNIEVPNYPLFGDVTADTHQVAAAQLRPLSGTSPAVSHNLASGGTGYTSSALTGVQGTYGMTADATRLAAKELGLSPRAAQSASWEPVRELFKSTWKTPENAARVDNIWRAFDRGDISIEQARDAIFSLAGGIGTPGWARPGARIFAPTQSSTYR